MKTYIQSIQFTQKFLLAISIITMMVLPLIVVFYPDVLSEEITLRLYDVSHVALFLVMIVRPLADILSQPNKIRPLIILRKGAGVFSASIIVSFILAKIIMDTSGYFGSIITAQYWSFENLAILAHLGDLSAILLIVTSNNLSKRILGSWWKKIQKLSYVYFYASSLYVFFTFEDNTMWVSMLIVTLLTCVAYIKNEKKRALNPQIV